METAGKAASFDMNWLLANGPLIAGAVIAVLLLAWLLFRSQSKAAPRSERRPDVLDEGAAPARRNQAFIDAPRISPLVTPPAPTPVPVATPEPVVVAPVTKPVEELRVVDVAVEVVEVAETSTPLSTDAPAEQESVAVKEEISVHVQAVEETVTSAPVVVKSETVVVVPSAVPTASGVAADLRRIKGLGPKLATLLEGLGVTNVTQIAAWSEADIERLDAQLGAFSGRIRRDQWVEQAKLLISEDKAAYEAKFGSL